MKLAAALACVSLLAGCGYVGDPLPPALNIPAPIADLQASQIGDSIILRFSIPALTTEQLPVKDVAEVDLRAGTGDFHPDDWAAQSTPIPVPERQPGPVEVHAPILPAWQNREVIFAVRLRNDRGRYSAWSNLAPRHVVPPVSTPASVKAESASDGIRLSWTGTAQSWNILREGQAAAEVAKPEYLDPAVEPGKTYEYRVQALVKAGDQMAYSEPAPAVSLLYRDTFPPAAPQKLQVVAGTRAIELSWDRNLEADFKHYRIWRNGQVVADGIEIPAYTDAAISAGTKYQYAVSAVDTRGNESPQSQSVEISAP